jgi:hypothetical protein
VSIDTVNDLPSRVQYVASAAQTDFDYPFPVFQDADLVVDVDGTTKTLTTHYTVAGEGNDLGGTVTFGAPMAGGEIVTIYRQIAVERSTDVQQNGPWSSVAYNDEQDKTYLILQQLDDRCDRSLRIPVTAEVDDADIELTVANYANKYLTFDADGKPTPAVLSSTTMTQAIVGNLLYPRTAAEISAGVTPTDYAYQIFDLRRYGADPTGNAFSDSAMSSAISVCGSTGGTILAPAGVYKFSSAISLSQKTAITIQGDGAPTSGAQPATRFIYSGTGSGVWISMQSSVGCRLRKLQLMHSGASFTGTYIKCGNDGSHGDSTFCGIEECVIGASASGTTHLDLDKCINWSADRCLFHTGNPSVKGQANTGSSYSNVVRFRDCEWYNSTVAPVYDCGQSWIFEGCTFEKLSGGGAGAILSSNGTTSQVKGLTISGCWFGDATSGGTWIDISGQAIFLSGNYISSSATSTGINCRSVSGINVFGNTFDTLSIGMAFTSSAEVVVKGNIFNSVSTVFSNGNNVSQGYADVGANYGAGILGSNHGSLGNNGFFIDPNRVVRQWGSVSVTTGTPNAMSFPITFPSNIFNIVVSLYNPSGTNNSAYVSAVSTSGATINVGGTAGSNTVYWQAVGL